MPGSVLYLRDVETLIPPRVPYWLDTKNHELSVVILPNDGKHDDLIPVALVSTSHVLILPDVSNH